MFSGIFLIHSSYVPVLINTNLISVSDLSMERETEAKKRENVNVTNDQFKWTKENIMKLIEWYKDRPC